jgi:triacylglycerol lipase
MPFFLHRFIQMITIIALFSLSSSSVFGDWQLKQANISVWLSGAAYCHKTEYTAMKIGGPATGFEVTHVLYNKTSDLHGFAGILSETKTIYLVFRGTKSILNWMEDIEIQLVPHSLCDAPSHVHLGFYESSLGIREQAVNALTNLRKIHPDYQVLITGHSYGAAVSQLIGMEIQEMMSDVEIYNFGQPRVGDANYSACVNKIFSEHLYRFVHDRDIVPHLPTAYRYRHSCREIFETADGDLITCGNDEMLCEDPACSSQYALQETAVEDHYFYLGHEFACETSIY